MTLFSTGWCGSLGREQSENNKVAINQAIDKIKFSATCWQKEPHQNRKRAVNPREAGVNPFTPVFFSFVRPGVSPNRAPNKILARYNCAGHQINSGPDLLWHNTKMTKWFCGAEFIPGRGIFFVISAIVRRGEL